MHRSGHYVVYDVVGMLWGWNFNEIEQEMQIAKARLQHWTSR